MNKGKNLQAHTPGPWELFDSEQVHPTWNKGADLKGSPTGISREKCRMVKTSIHACSVAIIPSHSTDADARLIAAAPELLEAAKIGLALANDELIDFEKYGFKSNNDMRAFIRAAITKAQEAS